jgi:CDP-diacylglycerol--glycerol-3-phosphate 3-phosphatidyltransferase
MNEPMSDEEFVRAFLSGELPPSQFHHRDHLRLTWTLTRTQGGVDASRIVTTGIRDFATRHGQAAKYHETMTRFWAHVVDHCARTRPDIADFNAFLATFPLLLDKDLPYRHWRRETMLGADARARWVEPDLLALPA